jgi:alkaline phosphatase
MDRRPWATGALRCLLLAVASAVGCLLLSPVVAGANEPPEHWFQEGRQAIARARALERASSRNAKNVILFLGDGMGVTTVTAARILEGQRAGQPGEENLLAFERLPHVALIKPYNTNQQTPDSAGTMTAILTGAKTRAGVISVNASVARTDFAAVEGNELPTMIEQAEDRGLSTGLVTTARLTHATPAAAYAHGPERSWECDADLSEPARAAGFADMARQLIEFDHGDGIDVALGGGRAKFQPSESADAEYPKWAGSRLDGRDLTREWTAGRPGARYVWNREQFDAIGVETEFVLGLFEPGHMQFEADRAEDGAGEPSLSEMTAKAIALLSRNPRGYVLIVEGGRIDHGHHLNNAYRALTDAVEMSNAVDVALRESDSSETLVVVTADHGHTLHLVGYPTRGNDILGRVVGNDATGAPLTEPTRDAAGKPYTTLGYVNGPGRMSRNVIWPWDLRGWKAFWTGKRARHKILARGPDRARVDTTDRDYVQRAVTPLWSETHTGEDVAAYAGGPGSSLFHGVQEQSYLYHAMIEALGWTKTEPSPQAR